MWRCGFAKIRSNTSKIQFQCRFLTSLLNSPTADHNSIPASSRATCRPRSYVQAPSTINQNRPFPPRINIRDISTNHIMSGQDQTHPTESSNPHALDHAQDPEELFEVMHPPPSNFDPYNDRPVSTKTYATRGEVHRQGMWHCSVHIWIAKASPAPGASPSFLLLQKRSMNKDTFPGTWDISSAGHMEAGKGSLETACAELAEELGVVLEMSDNGKGDKQQQDRWKGGLQYAFTIPAETKPLGGCNAYEHVYFLIQNDTSGSTENFSLGTEEVSEVSWVPTNEVLNALRTGDDGYAPRTKEYVAAMTKELTRILGQDCM